MDVPKTRQWVQSHRRIKDAERQLIFAALDSVEALADAPSISRADLEAIANAARTRAVAVWDIGGRALAELACRHAEAQQIFRELAASGKNNERFQAISCLSKEMPKPFVQELLSQGLNDRSKSVRLRAAMICDSLHLYEILPELDHRTAIEPDAQVKQQLEFHAAMIRDGYLIERKKGRLSLCVRVRNGWSWQDVSQEDLNCGHVPKIVADMQARPY